VNPGRDIFGAQMHGITNAEVAGAPVAKEAAEKLLAFVAGAPVVGHNVGFDVGFLDMALGENGKFIEGGYFDTLVIAREGYPDLESYKLGDIAKFFGIAVETAHRGLADAETTAAILAKFAEDLPNRIQNLMDGIGISIRANRKEGEDPAGLLEAARRQVRVSKGLFQLVQKKTVRNMVLDEGIAWTAAARRDPAHHRGGRRSAARPRLRTLHPRPDAGVDRGHSRSLSDVQRIDTTARRPRSGTSTTTTCHPTAPARTSRCAVPAGVRSATATSPNGPFCPSCPRRRVPVRHPGSSASA